MKELGRIIQLNKKEEEGYCSCTDKDAGLPQGPNASTGYTTCREEKAAEDMLTKS